MDSTPEGVAPVPHVQWVVRPTLHDRPGVLVAAFEGWNDAGDAASSAVRHLERISGAQDLADMDPEVFYDFTIQRPEVHLEGRHRVLDWPEITITGGAFNGLPVYFLLGNEPHLRWRTFCTSVLGAARTLGVSRVVTLGALLSETPHTRPVPVFGSTYDQVVDDELGLAPSSYEGPTGIVGVLSSTAGAAGFTTASFWAAVPTYASGATSPKASLALVERLASYLRIHVPTTDLEIATAAYERQISELVAEDDDTQAFVTRLEEEYDEEADLDAADELVAEVEQFLRNQER